MSTEQLCNQNVQHLNSTYITFDSNLYDAFEVWQRFSADSPNENARTDFALQHVNSLMVMIFPLRISAF